MERKDKMKKSVVVSALLFSLCLIFFSAHIEQTKPVSGQIAVAQSTKISFPLQSTKKISESPKTKPETTSQTSSMTETPALPQSESSTTAQSDLLGQEIDNICQKYNAVGMSLAVFKGQDVIYLHSYGYADVKNGIKATENTKYRIASISKTITGILAMRLAAAGKLNLDADISQYMGIEVKSPFFPDVPITSRMLMTHTSGIVDSPAYETITDGYDYPSLTELMSLGGMFTQYRPGEKYIYSNLAAGLLCGVIEGISGERFYTYAENELFKPLGIDAGFLRTRISDAENIALIYKDGKISANTKSWGRVESAYDKIPLGQMYLLGYGDLFITAKDLAKFGIALAGDGTCGGFEILPKEYVDQMNSLQFSSAKYKRGLCLSIEDNLVRGRRLYGHPGQSYGMVSGMYYDPSDSTGVVFITNGCSVAKNSYGIYTISNDIVNAVYKEFFN
ncbi:MAG: hypothetical protein PWQ76_125 [Clostridiales bacterium]|jgi:CubicO group peptidase (beta-lactamase class C family)|nr:D-alanyl-D-alanine carboxypeptidase precursor [Oscillospiraceae bacterium]MDN5377873.1 hypothetical protein [Clostridiales bacterium]